ncbi:uncharacterized protein LOC122064152 [Macadamia integrifolia]|uniref:uncharacterized protein LOC122064152 n=1 Tax=Macadamia integrifolia TaxID=60698 RepID=UPI001C4F540D|nr:uncharacterized protein LOC122064152 [Macadamia integrifolia]
MVSSMGLKWKEKDSSLLLDSPKSPDELLYAISNPLRPYPRKNPLRHWYSQGFSVKLAYLRWRATLSNGLFINITPNQTTAARALQRGHSGAVTKALRRTANGLRRQSTSMKGQRPWSRSTAKNSKQWRNRATTEQIDGRFQLTTVERSDEKGYVSAFTV